MCSLCVYMYLCMCMDVCSTHPICNFLPSPCAPLRLCHVALLPKLPNRGSCSSMPPIGHHPCSCVCHLFLSVLQGVHHIKTTLIRIGCWNCTFFNSVWFQRSLFFSPDFSKSFEEFSASVRLFMTKSCYSCAGLSSALRENRQVHTFCIPMVSATRVPVNFEHSRGYHSLL